MRQDDSIDEMELLSLLSNESLLAEIREDGVQEDSYPSTVVFEDHQVFIDSVDIKQSKRLRIKYVILAVGFFGFGLSDAAIGTVMPTLMQEYGIDHSEASYMFSSQFFGYLLSSLMSNFLISSFGFYGAMLVCSTFSSLCFLIISIRPPFAVIVAAYTLNGFGAGILDSAGNLWIGKLAYYNQLLGLIHAFYGLGGIFSPIFVTKLINSCVIWSRYYLLLGCLNTGILVSSIFAFRDETKWKHRYLKFKETPEGETMEEVKITEVLTSRLVWFFSFVLFVYAGGELLIGSWLYNYLLVVKDISTTSSSYITSCYWLFMTLGRVVLGFVIGHWFLGQELTAVLICCTILLTGSLFFTIFYHFLALQVISICLIGFFVGPMFPTIVVVGIKFLPTKLETAGVGMLIAMGGGGAAVIPYLIGLVSTLKPNGGGLVYFPFVMFLIFTTDLICFLIFFLRHRKIPS